ncbi:MAG: Hpt domain-containing protein, partial [Burkholderiales bacterium]|nr:Hpt domain-containing protein [Burkholderiales bacterium]
RAALLGPDEAARHAVRAELAQAVAGLAPPAPPAVPVSAPIPPARTAPPGDTGLEDDAEMREIFIEEAREVVAEAHAALQRLAETPDHAGDLTAVRRAFHTLKGSSRMVGLRDFGDAAWACEQLYNARLAVAPRLDGALRQLTTEALAYLGDWTEAIASGAPRGHRAADVTRAADALREGQSAPAIVLPAVPVQAAAAATAAPHPGAGDGAAPGIIGLGFELPPELPPQPAPEPGLEPDFEPALDAAPAPMFEPGPGAEPSLAASGFDASTDFASTDFLIRGFEPTLPPEAPVEAGLAFEFDLGPLDPPPSDLPALDQRVPDLPSQADLELGPLPLPELPAEMPSQAPAEPPSAASPVPEGETHEIDLADLPGLFDAPAAPEAAPAAPPAPDPEFATEPVLGDEEQVKRIGPLRISIPLFNIYLNEADELSRRLGIELAEWAHEHERHPVPESSEALAHSLAGSSATVGYGELSALARALEHALQRSRSQGVGRAGEPALFSAAADEIRRLLHQFAAGFLRQVEPGLMDRLAAHERLPLAPLAEEPAADDQLSPGPAAPLSAPEAALPEADADVAADAAAQAGADDMDAIDAIDVIDTELFPIFEEEAEELLPQLQSRLREWHGRPGDPGAAMACMRTLHTLKGGARLAGAMRLGEMAHRLETEIEALAARGDALAADIDPLLARSDAMGAAFDGLRRRPAPSVPPATPLAALAAAPAAEAVELDAEAAVATSASSVATPVAAVPPAEPAEVAEAAEAAALATEAEAAPKAALPVIDWRRFAGDGALAAAAAERAGPGNAVVRVRAGLLD